MRFVGGLEIRAAGIELEQGHLVVAGQRFQHPDAAARGFRIVAEAIGAEPDAQPAAEGVGQSRERREAIGEARQKPR